MEKVIGIKRKVDSCSRVLIPSEYLKELGLKKGAEFEMFLVEGGIYLKVREVINE